MSDSRFKAYTKYNKSEKKKTVDQRYRDNNKERCKLSGKLYREKNKEKIVEQARLRRATTAGKEQLKKLNKKRRTKTNAWYNNRYKTDLQFKALVTLRARQRQALKDQGIIKKKGTMKDSNCTVEFFIEYIAKQFQPGMNWSNHGEWHIDHIKPCSKFDLTDPEQQKECFHYSNLQPLWAVDNIKKGAN